MLPMYRILLLVCVYACVMHMYTLALLVCVYACVMLIYTLASLVCVCIEMSESLPSDAARRLLELKKKIMGGSKSHASSPAATPPPVESPPVPRPLTKTASPLASKPPLTLKSLMGNRLKKSLDGQTLVPQQTSVQSNSTPQHHAPANQQTLPESAQPPVRAFVSRLKEAPAHRVTQPAEEAVVPKLIRLTRANETVAEPPVVPVAPVKDVAPRAAPVEDVAPRPKLVRLTKTNAELAIAKKLDPSVIAKFESSGPERFINEKKEWLNEQNFPHKHFQSSEEPVDTFIQRHLDFLKSFAEKA